MSSILLLGTLSGLILTGGWIAGGPAGLLGGLAIAVVIVALAYSRSARFLLWLFKAQPYEHVRIRKMLEHLSREAKVIKPRIYLIKSPLQNSMALGSKNPCIVLTEGLLRLEDNELKGVLAHEIAHIKNRDAIASTMAAAIGSIISYPAQLGYYFLALGRSRIRRKSLSLLSLILFTPLAAFLVRYSILGNKEYKADWIGALLTKDPEALASALRTISRKSRDTPAHGNAASSHMWIVNPFRDDWFYSLFSVHPEIEKRIETLEVSRMAEVI